MTVRPILPLPAASLDPAGLFSFQNRRGLL